MRLSDHRRYLLGLIGPKADAQLAEQLDDGDWQTVNAMAAQHRIQPWLHAQIERGLLDIAAPGAIREDWRQAHRRTALRALAMRRDLLEANTLLTANGITSVALKGAWCAWHAYAAAAERPMRDIDLLVPQAQALEAFDLLIGAGFRQEEASARTPEQSLVHDKHLPPLLSPQGHRFELHMRLWERDAAIGWPMPDDASTGMYARATRTDVDPVRYLAGEDMLAHFVVHGVYSNRLNGGPLSLLDVDFLLRAKPIDWPDFWQSAGERGWAKGATLLLTLVDHWCGSAWCEQAGCPHPVETELIDSSPDLLLQDLEERKAVGLATHLSTNIGSAAKRLSGKDRATEAGGGMPDTSESRIGWLTRRLRESAKALAKPDVRKAAGKTVRLGQWLEGE